MSFNKQYCRLLMLLMMALAAGRVTAQTIQVYTGYEQEYFRWSIAGNSAGMDPNVYSELRWRAVGGVSAAVGLQWQVWKRWQFFAAGSRVFTRRGSLTDMDYGLDNRHDVLYDGQFPVTGGYSEAGTVGVGYRVLNGRVFELTPFLGYSLSKQYFPVTDPGGVFYGLNSSYTARWAGPLVKAEACWKFFGAWKLEAEVEYDQVTYHAEADWNLIPTFSHPVSFRHHADGYGVTMGLGLRYAVGRHVEVVLKGQYFDWETGKGIDEVFLATGGTQQTQLNEVVRDGFGGRLGLGWKF